MERFTPDQRAQIKAKEREINAQIHDLVALKKTFEAPGTNTSTSTSTSTSASTAPLRPRLQIAEGPGLSRPDTRPALAVADSGGAARPETKILLEVVVVGPAVSRAETSVAEEHMLGHAGSRSGRADVSGGAPRGDGVQVGPVVGGEASEGGPGVAEPATFANGFDVVMPGGTAVGGVIAAGGLGVAGGSLAGPVASPSGTGRPGVGGPRRLRMSLVWLRLAGLQSGVSLRRVDLVWSRLVAPWSGVSVPQAGPHSSLPVMLQLGMPSP
jgi:hypothetical protein